MCFTLSDTLTLRSSMFYLSRFKLLYVELSKIVYLTVFKYAFISVILLTFSLLFPTPILWAPLKVTVQRVFIK